MALAREPSKSVQIAGVEEDSGDNEWENIIFKVDSGAIDTCIPKSSATAFPIHESIMSKSGMSYRAANGSHVVVYGERQWSGLSEEWVPSNIKAPVQTSITSNYGGFTAEIGLGFNFLTQIFPGSKDRLALEIINLLFCIFTIILYHKFAISFDDFK